jgi:predicted SprT family Zn-dependent metalloprotease
MSLLNTYSDDELRNIVKLSNSWRDLSRKLGYNSNSGDLKKQIQRRVEELNIDTSHFTIVNKNAVVRTEENVFIENSTANQTVLRRFYLKGNYSPYRCSICGLPPYWQEQPLTLILDHINGINNDDRLENLRWVCPNCNMQLPTTNRRKDSLTKKYYCQDCGKEVSHKETICCAECAAKRRIIPISEMQVTREELKNLIRIMPFTKIGKKFGVSDNAIRKWCDKMDLPRKVNIIKQYTDEEWAQI